MDPGTREYYTQHADRLGDRHERARAGIDRYFARAFRPGSRVLDLGCGTGRDVALLVRKGLEAYGVEPVDAMRRVAVERHPDLAERFWGGELPEALPDLQEHGGPFDGVVCSAVFHHIPRRRLFDAAFGIKRLLKPGGHLLLSLRRLTGAASEEKRDGDGRLHNGVGPDEAEILFHRVGFDDVERWENEDALGRADFRWTTLLLRLRTEDMLPSSSGTPTPNVR